MIGGDFLLVQNDLGHGLSIIVSADPRGDGYAVIDKQGESQVRVMIGDLDQFVPANHLLNSGRSRRRWTSVSFMRR